VQFKASFDNAREALVFAAPNAFRPDVRGPGVWVFTPARVVGPGEAHAPATIVIVNRGFVPDARRDPGSRREGQITEPIEITGVLRWAEERHWFTPADDPEHNLWFTRDPAPMAGAKGLDPRTIAPFYVEQESPAPRDGLPQPGKLVVALPDNHLQYAITWYGLAVVLAASFGVWTFTSRRRSTTDMA
jgi:surfeit locus 1 family protein